MGFRHKPIGIELSDLDGTWVSTVDSFGVDRREVAHSVIGTQKPIDPGTELATVTQVRAGFLDLDKLLNSLPYSCAHLCSSGELSGARCENRRKLYRVEKLFRSC
jgi:hypothetical protein